MTGVPHGDLRSRDVRVPFRLVRCRVGHPSGRLSQNLGSLKKSTLIEGPFLHPARNPAETTGEGVVGASGFAPALPEWLNCQLIGMYARPRRRREPDRRYH